ncbi:LuxR C-terminal-related transcriptional regulator [Phenylobacterium sp.]|uniref:helix-turn-helix transcriptional regulator n=1 Tax=Phenylobacterium sp. TaxID=1871053 RepID=UPI00286D25E7|nr:LuxR C-terminal-related transcriptional regulator [Phenylobacterium sp.]
MGNAASLADAALPLKAIGVAIGLSQPGVVEDFTAKHWRVSINGGFGELFGQLAPRTNPESEPVDQRCPIGRACRVSVDPFAWRVARVLESGFPWDPGLDVFSRRTAEKGIVGGVTVPVHLPMSRVGAVGWLAIDHDVDVDQILATYSNELRLAAHLFMGHVYRERPDAMVLLPHVSLSERELECLTWVAMGKTDADIAELIGRSPSTARFHVESAVSKLGVNNRTRAAAVASQMGMIRAVA